MIDPRPVIRFTHDEVEALLHLIAEVKDEELTIEEASARNKLKRIYARQILSHEKRERQFEDERIERANAETNNS